MKKYNSLEYLKLSKIERFFYKFAQGFLAIPLWFKNLGITIFNFFKKICHKIKEDCIDIYNTFKYGDGKTRASYFLMGFGSFARGQILRGILFSAFEIVFIVYMIFWGGHWLGKLVTLGTEGPALEYDPYWDTETLTIHDNSFKILLYGILTIFFIVGFIWTWRLNIKQNKINELILASGKPIKSSKDDIKSLADNEFHKSLLALPLIGILIFTVMPILFMILVAFTNYDSSHNGSTNNLFTWVGLDNFNTLLDVNGNMSVAFGEILAWTLIWAFFATFTNYFLGMAVAILINKKGIKLKKFWRTVLVLTIAIPQFISLLFVSKMFSLSGIVNGTLIKLGWIDTPIDFWGDTSNNGLLPKIMVILVNLWVGIPYLMLIVTGILMNIPEDLYESSKIDGANVWQQYIKITLPYMLFITGPYLLTSFTSNMNNFNVIYLLTSGGPTITKYAGVNGDAGYTDLLVTWLFKIVDGGNGESQYYYASVIGIFVFIVVAGISLIVYNVLPSVKNEEDYQ